MCGCGHVIQLTLAINHLCFLNLLYFCLWYKYVLFIATVFAWNSGRCFMFPLSRLPRVLPVPREWRCLLPCPHGLKLWSMEQGGWQGPGRTVCLSQREWRFPLSDVSQGCPVFSWAHWERVEESLWTDVSAFLSRPHVLCSPTSQHSGMFLNPSRPR